MVSVPPTPPSRATVQDRPWPPSGGSRGISPAATAPQDGVMATAVVTTTANITTTQAPMARENQPKPPSRNRATARALWARP